MKLIKNNHLMSDNKKILNIETTDNDTMKLQQAETIAKNFLSEIKEFCERIEIAGSIRRKKPEVNDIDIVLIPRQKKDKIKTKF